MIPAPDLCSRCQAALWAAERGSGGVGALLSGLRVVAGEHGVDQFADHLLLALGKLSDGIELAFELGEWAAP